MQANIYMSIPCCLIISGASGGYGAELAKCFLAHLQPESIIVLTSRASDRLYKVEKEILLLELNEIKVKVLPCDLSVIKDVENFFADLKNINGISKVESVILVHNAGTLGDVSLTIDQYNYDMINEHFKLNVSNVVLFTKKFIEFFNDPHIAKCLVNVSSLCALKPFPTMGLYCTAKAARDMMFRVLALERKDVKVLNWAPGPMPTKMLVQLSNSSSVDVSKKMKSLLNNKTYVECKASGEKLIKILKSGKFDSGQHIDFYDI